MNILLITFIGGFILATLIFWPLLRRAHRRTRNSAQSNRPRLVQRAEANSTHSRGKHAVSAAETADSDVAVPAPARPSPHTLVRGRHALTQPAPAAPATPDNPTTSASTESADSTAGTPSSDSRTDQPAKVEFAHSIRINGELPPLTPQQNIQQREIPIMSTNLYQRKFAWRFERSHQRLRRLRSEIAEWPLAS